ncbi:SDR family NAD(P)-dependent oxidoreductase [Nocardia sp. NPDC059091]|uniref:SDR family NAD(P)-dependent oxidoreductase n=1 Tax=unclassified Nocardia TaxID=2637762 RepID=UPI0036AB0F48
MLKDRMLADRAAVVVGGGTGVGLSVARELAARGAGVIINSRDENAVREAAALVVRDGGKATGIAGSAADTELAEQLVETCVAEYGGIDILVNCAGIAEPPGSSILEVSPVQWRELLDSHLTTVFNTCRLVAPLMAAKGTGAIINTGSFEASPE